MKHVHKDPLINDEVRLSALAELKTATICHPSELLIRTDFTVDEKRALLASWASDARALEHAPTLRQLDSGALVSVTEILSALRLLDESERSGSNILGKLLFLRRKNPAPKQSLWRSRDDDDDPPPAPAGAMPVPRPPLRGGCLAVARCA